MGCMANIIISQSKSFTQCSICTATTALCLYTSCHDNGLFSFSCVGTSRIGDCLVFWLLCSLLGKKMMFCVYQGEKVEGLQAQALYPWRAKKDNHLNFNKNEVNICSLIWQWMQSKFFMLVKFPFFSLGKPDWLILFLMQIITVLEQQDMWWLGELQTGQRGWFPKSYVKLISATVAAPVATAARSKNMRCF